MKEVIVVENLVKSFKLSAKQMKTLKTKDKKKIAVNDISFTTYEGEIFGLVGPNGAGKTTALRCISTLIKPDSGKITIKGIDISEEIKIKKKLAFLTSELKLEDKFTPNYLFDYYSNLHDVPKDVAAARKEDLFTRFEIGEFSDTKIGDLSTGMKQKVSVAISLVHQPEIIVFDEPTNGLDVYTAKIVTDYLLELKEQGKSIIISTHIMSLVEKLCDRVGLIFNGKLVVCDTVENVMNSVPSRDLEDVFIRLYKEEGTK
ncbi:MAG TPA: ABC transporter ATP-binding protein [Acholeplasma sp.]|jgi:ABC-type multidrug transport system ATPase subunit|nr:ABC transporter ATP-binding protein [Acholeplasma sp.]